MNHESNEIAEQSWQQRRRSQQSQSALERRHTISLNFASPDAVAVRAYELFEERGREPGRDVDDWLRAERELEGARR